MYWGELEKNHKKENRDANWKHTEAGVVVLRGILERSGGTFSKVTDCCRDDVGPLAVQTVRRACYTVHMTCSVQHLLTFSFQPPTQTTWSRSRVTQNF